MKKSLVFLTVMIAITFTASFALASNAGGGKVVGMNAVPSAAADEGRALVFDLSPGTGAPPATLGGFAMTPVPYPGAPACTGIQPPLPTPGGDLDVDPTSGSRCIGSGWATWSHGYVGDVYFTGGAMSQTITLPAGTSAFYLYVEPNPFSLQTFEVVAEPGGVSSGSFSAEGSAGAAYCGVYDSAGASITSVTITGSSDFATGEYGISLGGEPPFILDLDASYVAGSLSLEFDLGAPDACTWVTLLILTQPSVQVIPLWAMPLPAISPPVTIPLSFPFPEIGTVVVFSALFTTEIEVKAVEVVQTTMGDIVFDTSVGTSAPPATLGGYSMSPVPYPGAPACTGIQPPLPTPGGGTIGLDPLYAGYIACIGSGWATWSHGYIGDVYFHGYITDAVISPPAGTNAVYLYVEPNPFELHTFQAECGGATSAEFDANGSSGAAYLGVYDSTGGGTLGDITLTCVSGCAGGGFATGEYGWSD